MKYLNLKIFELWHTYFTYDNLILSTILFWNFFSFTFFVCICFISTYILYNTHLLWKNPEEWDWPRYTSMYSTLLPPSHISPSSAGQNRIKPQIIQFQYLLFIDWNKGICSVFILSLPLFLTISNLVMFISLLFSSEVVLRSKMSSATRYFFYGPSTVGVSVKNKISFFFRFLPVVLFSSFFLLLYISSSISSCSLSFVIFFYLSSLSSLFL